MTSNLLNVALPICFILIFSSPGPIFSEGTNITIVNHCKETIWPGITPSENISNTGLALKPGQSTLFTPPPDWHGRIWGRTNCTFDNNGNGTCQTGSCDAALKCSGPGQQPATIAEFTLGQTDFYDISLVGGFNLPMTVTAVHGKGNCSTAGCDGDLRDNCPSQLAAKSDDTTIACQSPCDVFNTDEYCCRGEFGSPMSCKATNYSTSFKKVCPAAYSYAYDDRTSLITCSSVSDYVVAFCTTRNQTLCTYNNQKLSCDSSRVSSISFNVGPRVSAILMAILFSGIS